LLVYSQFAGHLCLLYSWLGLTDQTLCQLTAT
jgi:hypothetical protein